MISYHCHVSVVNLCRRKIRGGITGGVPTSAGGFSHLGRGDHVTTQDEQVAEFKLV